MQHLRRMAIAAEEQDDEGRTFITIDASRQQWDKMVRAAVAKGSSEIRGAILHTRTMLQGVNVDISADADLVRVADGYAVRTPALTAAKQLTEKHHAHVIRRAQLCGWLYEQMFGQRPVRIEVVAIRRDTMQVAYDGGEKALAALAEIIAARRMKAEPYTPVGMKKCRDCRFYERCWDKARSARDVSIVKGVDQGLARALHERGVLTLDDLLEQFDELALASFRRPVGRQIQRVGIVKALRIMETARAIESDKPRLLRPLHLPRSANYVVFDVEALGYPFGNGDVFLWGLQVCGEEPSPYIGIDAGFGRGGDRRGWKKFMARAAALFDQYGEIPFVHWGNYERTCVNRYAAAYPDNQGTGRRLERNLFDLCTATRDAVMLPFADYSLKSICKYLGFEMTNGHDGQWAMDKYIEARVSKSRKQRSKAMQEIARYNSDDLRATAAAFEWLKNLSGTLKPALHRQE